MKALVIFLLFGSAAASDCAAGDGNAQQCDASKLVGGEGDASLSLLQREALLAKQMSAGAEASGLYEGVLHELSAPHESDSPVEADVPKLSLLQLGSELESHSTESILATVQSMAEQDARGELHADKLTEAIIKTIIEQMEKNVIKAADTQHKEDQNEVNRMLGDITKCKETMENKFNANPNGVNALKQTMETAKSTLTTCKTDLVTKITTKEADCTAFTSFVTGLSSSKPSCVCTLPKTPSAAVLQCIDQTKSWGTSSSTSYVDLKGKCDAATSAEDSKTKACDTAQGTFESSFCSYGEKLTDTCADYEVCHTDKSSEYVENNAEIKVAETSRKAEFVAAKKVICFVGVFKAKAADKSKELKTCTAKTYSTAHLDISYPTPPSAAKCDVSPVATKPCDGAFISDHYGASWSTKAPAATCVPCAWSGGGGGGGGGGSAVGGTLIMQIKASSSVLHYDSSYWTNGQTLNPTLTSEVEGQDAVLPAFSSTALTGLRICVEEKTHCYTYFLGKKYASAKELFSGGTVRADDMGQEAFEDLFDKDRAGTTTNFHAQRTNHLTCLQKPGVNTQCRDNNRARFGFCGNLPSQPCQPSDNHDSDFAIGIGCHGQNSVTRFGAGFNDYYAHNVVDRTGAKTVQAWVYAVYDATYETGTTGFMTSYTTNGPGGIVPVAPTPAPAPSGGVAYCKRTLAAGVLVEEDFESGSLDCWAGKDGKSSPATFGKGPYVKIIEGSECFGGSGKCVEFTGCSAYGDLFNKNDDLKCTHAKPCKVEYQHKGGQLYAGFSHGFPNGHSWSPGGITQPDKTNWHKVEYCHQDSYKKLMWEVFANVPNGASCGHLPVYIDSIKVTQVDRSECKVYRR